MTVSERGAQLRGQSSRTTFMVRLSMSIVRELDALSAVQAPQIAAPLSPCEAMP